MNPRRQLGAVLAAAVLAGVAGCDTLNTTGTEKPLESQTVEVAATWTGTEQANFLKGLKAFEDKTGAETKYTSGGNDLTTLINSPPPPGPPPHAAPPPPPP